jgi:hypothetical protein
MQSAPGILRMPHPALACPLDNQPGSYSCRTFRTFLGRISDHDHAWNTARLERLRDRDWDIVMGNLRDVRQR